MTFIASVIAKKGVAITADSLVTSQEPILKYNRFIQYLNDQPKNDQGETLINPDAINNLFQREPVHTKDYEEKLFKLNDFTAITTTGAAYINNKSIADIVEEFKANQQDINDLAISFTDKLNQYSDFLNIQIREHLNVYTTLNHCTFIITYYEKHTHKTHIYKAIINETNSYNLANQGYNYVTLDQEPEWARIVCDGQNKLSDRVLYGLGKSLYSIFPIIVRDLLQRLNLQEGQGVIPHDFVDQLTQQDFYRDLFFADIEMLNISDLSVQQAVDLASLLMRLEVDFQKYTKNIPTVGGVIKLAVIDESGFRFIAGDKVEPPKHIHI